MTKLEYTFKTDTLFKEKERLRAKARHDEAQSLDNKAREIARKLIKRNRPTDEIVEDTGLSLDEVEKLRQQIGQEV